MSVTPLVITVTTLFGRFEIDGEIGRGAMGIVYRGRDVKINRPVAIKTISILGQEPGDEQEFRARFFLEAQAAGGLSHPGIVTIFDVGEEAESKVPYIVMEYVSGSPLSTILSSTKNRKLPLGPVLQLIQEIAEALHYAHTCGVIHRDIKPANILITRQGHAKIADFGIAKIDDSQMTLPGRALGSPAYMAPEQLTGAPADARSDLFSLGVILYTILTGHRPFQGNSATTVMSKVAHHDPVAVTTFESNLPPALDRIVLRAIAKDPTKRYQSGKELAQDLYNLRVSEDLLGETAASLVVGLESATTRTFGSPAESPFGKTGLVPNSTDTPVQARGTSERLIYLKGALVVAALAIVGGVLGSRLLFLEHHSKLVRTSIPAVATSSSHQTSTESPSVVASPPAPSQKVTREHYNTLVPPPVHPRPKPAVKTALFALKSEPIELASLEIEIRHHFVIARASVWLDDNLVFEREIEGVTKKHALIFQRTMGLEVGTIKLPAGPHTVKIRVQSGSDSYDMTKTVTGTVVSGRQSTLLVTCDRHLLEASFQ
jgi:serine/threonine protein kinase